jgi:hypothetical protein
MESFSGNSAKKISAEKVLKNRPLCSFEAFTWDTGLSFRRPFRGWAARTASDAAAGAEATSTEAKGHPAGVDVMIAIFGDFRRKNWRFSQKPKL